jgi:hypothetical protein
MARTTGRLQLFKPQPGDFVDVNADVVAQLTAVDTIIYPNVNYRAANQDWGTLAPPVQRSEKRFNLWDSSCRVADSSVIFPPGSSPWQAAESSQEGWILVDPAFFVAPYVPVATDPVYYRYCQSYPGSAESIFMFKGRISNTTGFAIIPSLTAISLMNVPMVPNVDTVQQTPCGRGGLLNNDYFQYTRVSYTTASGTITGMRVPCAGNAATQTAGNTNNYLSLDGFTLRGTA